MQTKVSEKVIRAWIESEHQHEWLQLCEELNVKKENFNGHELYTFSDGSIIASIDSKVLGFVDREHMQHSLASEA